MIDGVKLTDFEDGIMRDLQVGDWVTWGAGNLAYEVVSVHPRIKISPRYVYKNCNGVYKLYYTADYELYLNGVIDEDKTIKIFRLDSKFNTTIEDWI